MQQNICDKNDVLFFIKIIDCYNNLDVKDFLYQ